MDVHAVGVGMAHQIPPATAVLCHDEASIRQPLGLKHGDPLGLGWFSARDPTASLDGARGRQSRQDELGAIPGHGGLLPLHPSQLGSVGTQYLKQ